MKRLSPCDRIVFHYMPIIIWIGTIRSTERALILAFSRDADAVTNTAVMLDLFGRWPLVAMGLGFGLASAWACLGRVRSLPGMVACLWPQQALLTIAALGAARAIWTGVYADGTVRPQIYVFQDQAPLIWFTVGHGLAVWQLMRFIRRS